MNSTVFHYLDAQRQAELARELSYKQLEWRDADPPAPEKPSLLDRLFDRLLHPRTSEGAGPRPTLVS